MSRVGPELADSEHLPSSWAGQPGAGDARPDNLGREVRSYYLQTGDMRYAGPGSEGDTNKQATYVNDLYLIRTFPSVPMIIDAQTCSD